MLVLPGNGCRTWLDWDAFWSSSAENSNASHSQWQRLLRTRLWEVDRVDLQLKDLKYRAELVQTQGRSLRQGIHKHEATELDGMPKQISALLVDSAENHTHSDDFNSICKEAKSFLSNSWNRAWHSDATPMHSASPNSIGYEDSEWVLDIRDSVRISAELL